jgi:hypothetical protein
MVEIGKTKTIKRTKPSGEIVERVTSSIVRRVTRDEYGHNSRYTRKLVVVLHPRDLITIYPKGTRQKYSANIWDIYQWMVRGSVLKKQLEKARDRKLKKAALRERRRLDAAERRLVES